MDGKRHRRRSAWQVQVAAKWARPVSGWRELSFWHRRWHTISRACISASIGNLRTLPWRLTTTISQITGCHIPRSLLI